VCKLSPLLLSVSAMNKELNIIAIVPARGGSKTIPRKNIRLLNGKPLIYYTIVEALKSRFIGRIIVSTEDDEIAQIGKKYGAQVIVRPPQLAQDDTPSLPVFQHVIEYLEEAEGLVVETIVVLQPTSPLRTAQDIDRAIQEFLETGCDSVVSVCEVEHPPQWMYVLDHDKLKPFLKGGGSITRRQDAPKLYRPNGAVYVTRRNIIMKKNKLLGSDTRPYIMPAERSIDIDTELDFRLAEMLIKDGYRY